MEYNTYKYIVITKNNYENISLTCNYRMNNNGDLYIISYHKNDVIPQDVINNCIGIYTHEEILNIVLTNDWCYYKR